ncbi:MAG: translocation/assembly module TamB domain-containing protein [Deltaproteobacteria bacterium]
MRSKVLKPIAIFLFILALLAAVLVVVVQTRYFRNFVKITTNSIVTALTNQNFSIGSIEGNFLKGITLKNVRFDIENERFLDFEEIYIDYSLPLILDGSMLFSKVVPLGRVSVKGLKIYLVHYPDDSWNFEKLNELIVQGERRENPDWNVLMQKGDIRNAKMWIDDRMNGEKSEFVLRDADLSLSMFKMTDRAVLELNHADLTAAFESSDYEKMHFNDISGRAVYSNKEIIDKLDVEKVVFKFNEADYSAKGIIRNFMNPSFELEGVIRGIDIPEMGSLNVKIEAEGNSNLWKDLHARGSLVFVDSVFLDREINGGVETVIVTNTDVELKKGTLTADFGSAGFEGALSLREMARPRSDNEFDLQVLVKSLRLSDTLEMLEEKSEIKENGINNNIAALIKSELNIKGKWRKSSLVNADIDIKEMIIDESDIGRINLTGPLHITDSGVEYEIAASFANTNFGKILNDERYASDFNSDLRLKGSLDTSGETPDVLRVSVEGQVRPSQIMGINLNRAVIDAYYDKTSLGIKSLSIDTEPLKIVASGDIADSGGGGIKYDISFSDLGVLSRFSDGIDLSGSLDLKGDIRGSIKNPRLFVSAAGSDFVHEKQGIKIKKIQLEGESYFNLNDLGLNAGGELKGVEIQEREIQLIDFKARSLGKEIHGELGIRETPKRNYSMNFKLMEFGQDKTKLEVSKVLINFKDAVLENRRPIYITLLGDKINFNSFNLYHKDNFVIGDVSLGLDQSMEGTIKLERLSLLDLSQLLDVEIPVKGEVSGEISLGTSLKNPDIKANITAKKLEYMNFKSDELQMSLLFSASALQLNLGITDNSEEILSAVVEARFNLNMEDMERSLRQASYRAVIKSNGVDVSPITALNEEIQELDGKLLVDVVAEGSGGNPNVSGSLELKDISLKILAMRNKITIDSAVMDMRGKSGYLRPVTIRTGEGEGVFEGTLDFRDLSYTGKGKMSGMLMKTSLADVTANLDGNLEVEGKFLNAFIKGDIDVKNLKAVVPQKPLKEIENIKFVDENDDEREEFIFRGEKKDDYVEEFIALDLNVDIPKNSWVKGSGANIEVEGKLGIDKRYGDPYLVSGNIDVIRGDYQFMGRIFNIESGTVSFRGKKIINPFLDLRALYEVSSVQVYINITGTAEKPRIHLLSDPPLDENEIVSYLVFGTSSDKLGTDERIEFQEKAGEVLGAMAVGELRQMFGDDFAIDVMTIKGGQTGFRDTHLEIGKYLTEDLYVGYERMSYERFFYERYFFSPGLPSSTVTANRAVIEYRVTDFMTVESEIGEESGADLFFNFDY